MTQKPNPSELADFLNGTANEQASHRCEELFSGKDASDDTVANLADTLGDDSLLSRGHAVPLVRIAESTVRLIQGLTLSHPQTDLDHLGQRSFLRVSKFVTVGHSQQMPDWRPTIFKQQRDGVHWLHQTLPVLGLFGLGKQLVEFLDDLVDGRGHMFGFDLVVSGNAFTVQ